MPKFFWFLESWGAESKRGGVMTAQAATFTTNPTQEDYECAKERARTLLKSIVTEKNWEELEEKTTLTIAGSKGIYIISPYSQTEIYDLKSGKIASYSCLQLSIPVPTYDRIIAEYLLIKNDEDRYWETANFFHRNTDVSDISNMLFFIFDISLFLNLLWEILTIK